MDAYAVYMEFLKPQPAIVKQHKSSLERLAGAEIAAEIVNPSDYQRVLNDIKKSLDNIKPWEIPFYRKCTQSIVDIWSKSGDSLTFFIYEPDAEGKKHSIIRVIQLGGKTNAQLIIDYKPDLNPQDWYKEGNIKQMQIADNQTSINALNYLINCVRERHREENEEQMEKERRKYERRGFRIETA